MKPCQSCGHMLAASAVACPHCGDTRTPRQGRSALLLGFTVCALGVLLTSGGLNPETAAEGGRGLLVFGGAFLLWGATLLLRAWLWARR